MVVFGERFEQHQYCCYSYGYAAAGAAFNRLECFGIFNPFGKRVLWQYNTVLLGQNARMNSRE